jgi:dTDP-4-dehydrorhamnose reductase
MRFRRRRGAATANAMRILLLGCKGQVGHELGPALGCFAEVIGADLGEIDIADLDALRGYVRRVAPDLVVNAAAYNEVDRAEQDADAAFRVNAGAVGLLGEEMKRSGGALLHYSTDFVFDGAAGRAYREDDATNPLSRYGASKLAGERALAELDAPAIVLRTAWVWSLRRKSFVSAMLKLAREREVLKVVDDQVGCPTSARDLAEATALIAYGARKDVHGAFVEARGVYHAAGAGSCSRFELARAAIELDPAKSEHRVRSLEPVPTSAFPLPAKRPANAPLDCSKLRARFDVALPDWRASLARELGA